jgi:hypothetical protein
LTGAGAVALALYSTRYPLGAGDAAVNDPLIEVVLLLVSASAVGCADGAAQAVYVLPVNALLYDTIQVLPVLYEKT